ncbi:MAG: gliding motility protein GldN [Bacteroidota bacterium]
MYRILIIFCLTLSFIVPTSQGQVLDDITERSILTERKVLPYPPLREADIFWEKRIWRVIDVREKMNQPFVYPRAPLFDLISQAAEAGEITLYSPEDDQFNFPMDQQSLQSTLYQTDTIGIIDPLTQQMTTQVTNDRVFYEDIKRYRIKEVWFFDESTSSLRVRILGIAPMIEVRGEFGDVRYEKPLFWAYYPELRSVLAQHEVVNNYNDSSAISWEDLFEMRFFSSYIFKASNNMDLRIKDYTIGLDQLLEADKIRREIFDFEHDLWEY